MIFKQLFEPASSTFTYVIGDEKTKEVLVIDSLLENTDELLAFVEQIGCNLTLAIDTHTHADHITGMGSLRKRTGCITMMGRESGAACLSGTFCHGDIVGVGSISLKAIYTPGHTNDSYSFHLASANGDMLFSGDTLLIGGTGRTDFQGGDPGAQFDSLHDHILVLPDDVVLYPAHNYKNITESTLATEKKSNPLLQISNRQDYIDLMNSIILPDPKMMHIAVPANRACGDINGV